MESFLQVLHLTIMSHKHSNTWEEIYSFVHSLWVHIKFRMGCSSNYKSRIKSFFKLPWLPVFRSFDLLESHNQSIVQAKIKAIKKIDKSFAKLLLNDFDNFNYIINDYWYIYPCGYHWPSGYAKITLKADRPRGLLWINNDTQEGMQVTG